MADAPDLTSPPNPAPLSQTVLLPQTVAASGPPLSIVVRGRPAVRSPPGSRSRSPSSSRSGKHKRRHKHHSRSPSTASSSHSHRSKHSSASSHKRHKKHKKHHRTHSFGQFSEIAAEGTTVVRSVHSSAAVTADSVSHNRRTAEVAENPAHPSYSGAYLAQGGPDNTRIAAPTLQAASQPIENYNILSSLASEQTDNTPLQEFFVVELDNGGRALCETGVPTGQYVSSSQVLGEGGG